ncbi:MAG: alanine racemase, partial [Acetobacterales bacterium]
MKLADLRTPALILDRRVLAANCRRMTATVARHGVRLRPHMKTAKSIDVARVALDGNFGGITVSTLHEAEYFLGHGIRDIVYAVGIVPSKLADCAALIDRGADLKIVTDDPGVARAIAGVARPAGAPFRVLIEVDVGEHRGGLDPEDDALLEIGRTLHDAPGAELAGVLAHA